MFTLLLTWAGIAVGTTLLLLMALGPVIVELDGWLAARRRARREEVRTSPAVAARPAVQH
ncbi:hypothetical protein [Actinocrispum wychmicini]|uniref:Putative secreted protein with PEP-CTERM sorting signal n=1 Tax=Actinocrispum wychmicini TaxID=1213861 RepID=A0A4R2JVL0_9PSEU|nr:hypothetical protein [Actinocrispum wychmicini]TCO64501.1 putative secreted protein with PEP-CTERM sorting signal [Actinocrispum wychmicini]